MFILVAWRNLKICCFNVRSDTTFVRAQTENGYFAKFSGNRIWIVRFSSLYAPSAVFGNLCYRRWIMPCMLFDAADKNLCSVIIVTFSCETPSSLYFFLKANNSSIIFSNGSVDHHINPSFNVMYSYLSVVNCTQLSTFKKNMS